MVEKFGGEEPQTRKSKEFSSVISRFKSVTSSIRRNDEEIKGIFKRDFVVCFASLLY